MTYRLRFGLIALATAVSKHLSVLTQVFESAETAKINVTKPYKPRKLKLDPIHQMARKLYKMKMKNPNTLKKRRLYDKVYNRKNKMDLKRRAKFVRNAKERLGHDKRD